MFRERLDLLQRTVIALGDLAQDPHILTAPECDTGVVNVDPAKPRTRPNMATDYFMSHDI